MAKTHILVLYGGGVRGLGTAYILNILEEELKKYSSSVNEFYDCYAGTSCGAGFAMALSQGDNTKEVLKSFLKGIPKIFPEGTNVAPGLFKSLLTKRLPLGILSPRYKSMVADNVFQEIVGNKEPKKPLFITSYDVLEGKPIIFSNMYEKFKVKNHHYEVSLKNIDPWKAVACSSSVPMLFSPQKITVGKHNLVCIDGAFASNNAAFIPFAHYLSKGVDIKDIVLTVIGIGKKSSIRTRFPKWQSVFEWSAYKWFKEGPVMEFFLAGPGDVTNSSLSEILPKENFLFINYSFEKYEIGLFDAKPQKLQQIRTLVEKEKKQEIAEKFSQFLKNHFP